MIPKHGELDVKVYYEDTDSLGVVYYANYLKYIERGRTELMGASGRSVAEWNKAGYNFVVYKAELTFAAPARLGDVCRVITDVERGKSPYRMIMKQRVERDGDLLLDAVITLVCLDAEFQLREMPEGVLERDEEEADD